MNNEILADIKEYPIIGAIRDIDDVDMALARKPKCIFLLTGSILNIKYVVHCIKKAGKRAFLHIDLVEGISKDSEGTKYIVEEIRPDGIITTRSNLALSARRMGIFTIQRVFILDSLAVDTAVRTIDQVEPDAVEILPGVLTKTLKRISERVRTPLIAGGLIETEEEVKNALASGAVAISTTRKGLWDMDLL
ncbi:glycerol-3-phosphate responsive antiterminator [Tepidanaerobacter acetatoxydans]|uniref:glycerol-3-phosphate responsive antiterminator n=1 Tax=Tepidanaerobacter acetatoxydans TaxID=499229 RepID=UPI001BD5BA95|nr:glycerol-3-phosphate responsive antiterminator [Tepidanaerobacter acetatoxydans]